MLTQTNNQRAVTEQIYLPKRMYRKHGAYYFVNKQNQWIRLGDTFSKAMEEYEKISNISDISKHLKESFRICKKNAQARGIEFRITLDDILVLAAKHQNKCMLSGIPFEYSKISGKRARPWLPSIDRIESSRGYEVDNIRIICSSINYALNEWGDEVLFKIVRRLKKKARY